MSRRVTLVLITLVAACIAALWYFLHFSLVDEPELRGTLAHGELEWEAQSRTYTY